MSKDQKIKTKIRHLYFVKGEGFYVIHTLTIQTFQVDVKEKDTP